MISRYRPGVSLTLVRNPYFRQWSYAAQPAGYPNVIRFEQMADPRKQQSAVAAGRADLLDITWNDQPYLPLALQYPARVHPGLKVSTWYLFLNTVLPPFSNLQARRAVNYGIDRARVIQLLDSGPGQDAVTCQILPAGSPSYQRYCPYTAGPKDGGWHGPDLAKARQLVKQSGTVGMPVTVWNFLGQPVGTYLAGLFKRLGYRAKVREVSITQLLTAVADPRNKVQVGLVSWVADFPTASDYFFPVLTCHGSYNAGQYCNPRIDTLATQAQAEQVADPAAARALWAQLDRIVTNHAPWVPIFNQSLTVFVSARVGNYQESPVYGPLLDQIWVR
jgi:peptide/nickel transport system substrate-binding protein